MENFARRGIRTTVAVAGLAALGVGLAAPTAFALPSVPDISGVGNTQAVPSADGRRRARRGAPQPVPVHAARRRAVHGDRRGAVVEGGGRARGRGVDRAGDDRAGRGARFQREHRSRRVRGHRSGPAESTESTEAAPAAATPAPTTQGLLPSIPGSPVAAQASPQVAGVDPSSALQSLDSGSMF